MKDLFPHGTTVFVDIKRGMLFCTHDAPVDAWPATIDSTLKIYARDPRFNVHVPIGTPLIYMGPDNTKKPAHIATTPYAPESSTALYTPHAFLCRSILLIKPVLWDEHNYRPLGAIRGLFYVPDANKE